MENFNLNMIPSGVNPVCHVSQYDNGRQIKINLFNGTLPYELASGDTVTLNLRKPDNTIITASVTATQGNDYVIIATTEQMTAVVGETLGELKITNGSTVIGSLNFIMLVERDVLADGIPSQSVINDLDAQIESKFQAVIEPYTDILTQGVPYDLTFNSGNGIVYATYLTLPAGTYTLYINATSDNPNIDYVCVRFLRVNSGYAAANIITSVFPTKNKGLGFTFTLSETARSIYITAGTSLSGSSGYTLTLNSFKLYHDYYIDTTGVYDMTNVITGILTNKGACRLPAGDFKIKNIEMPDYTALFGSGEKTRLYFDDSISGIAVNMGSKCVVKDLQIYGADSDIQLPSTSDPVTDLLDGATWANFDGYKKVNIDLPAGTYSIDLNATSDNPDTDKIWFKVLKSTDYGTANVIYNVTTTKGESKIVFSVTEPIKSIYIFAASSVSGSLGYTVTVTSAALYWNKIGGRHAIGWVKSTNVAGMVANCFINRFNGSGILLCDQGYDIYRGLIISGCYIGNCNCGINLERNTEFNKITNSVISNNYFGILNRGGNNYISNCNIDGNKIGIQIDQDEGTNGGHGAITNCSINHTDGNTGYGLIVKDTGRMLVSNTNFYYSKILLKNTDGNVISGCGFGNSAAWEIDGGRCSIFVGCMVINSTQTPITITDNTKVQFLNCYTRAGDVVNW